MEDYNAEYIATCHSTARAVRHRRLICLPLDDAFDPPMGVCPNGRYNELASQLSTSHSVESSRSAVALFRNIVQVDLVEDAPPGSLARLRPHSSSFAKDISNPQAVLETQLRHYSSLTQGSTIAFEYNKKRYWFDVVELRSAPKVKSPLLSKCRTVTLPPTFCWIERHFDKRN